MSARCYGCRFVVVVCLFVYCRDKKDVKRCAKMREENTGFRILAIAERESQKATRKCQRESSALTSLVKTKTR